MYRLCSNASRVSHRTWMGARTRRVCEHPSSRHGGAVSEAAVEGTRAWTALGHREVPKKVPTAPLSLVHQRERLQTAPCTHPRCYPPMCVIPTVAQRSVTIR